MSTVSKYQNASGATLFRVRYRTPDGRQTDKRGFATKRDAEAFKATVEVAKLRGEYVSHTAGQITIGELGPEWLARQRGTMKPSSYSRYESAWRVHVAPRWERVAVSKVRFTDVQAWVTEMAVGGASRSTAEAALGVLNRILADAVRDRLMSANPTTGVKLPPKVTKPNRYLTREQLDMLADESGRYRSLVYLLGVGGLRWGEAAALRVSDIDFLRKRAHLHENAVRVGGKTFVGTLKGHKNRVVALSPLVLGELSVTCQGKGRDDLLWTTADGGYLGPPTHTSWLAYAVARCQAADPTFPRVTAHDLRHTATSLAISSGSNPKVVQRMLGHASAAMTMDVYADLFDSDMDAAAENVGKLWASGGQAT
jgi:integrase